MSKKLRVNDEVHAPEVFLIDETGKTLGKININDARKMASEKNLDLVEVSPNSSPPVTKIMDFGKFVYEQEKALRKQKVKGKTGETKEIRIGFRTGEHDREIKKRKIVDFLAKNHRVRISLRLKGREMKFLDEAKSLLENFVSNIERTKVIEPLKKENNILSITIAKNA